VHEVYPVDSGAAYPSEKDFLRAVKDHKGIAIVGPDLDDPRLRNAARDFDIILVTPHGAYTVEAKGTAATGELRTPEVDSWSIGEDSNPFKGSDLRKQARRQSQILSTRLRNARVKVGFIAAIAAISGDDVRLPAGKSVHFTGGVHILVSRGQVGHVIEEHVKGEWAASRISIEMALAIMAEIGCVASAPTVEVMREQGFLSNAEEGERAARVRDEQVKAYRQTQSYLALATPPPMAPEDGTLTLERWQEMRALDPDLCTVSHFIDGVAFDTHMARRAESDDVPLEVLADVVNRPTTEWAGRQGNLRYYASPDWTVGRRTSDGVAQLFSTAEESAALRDGTTNGGVFLTANAVRKARSLGLSWDAVCRIAAEPETEWTQPGERNLVRARCDFVAVLDPTGSQVFDVASRQVFERHLATASTEGRTFNDMTIAGFEVAARHLDVFERRGMRLSDVEELLSAPPERWPGHEPATEVLVGPLFALIVDPGGQRLLACSSRENQVDLRDGITVDGMHLPGYTLYRAQAMKVSPAAVAEVVRNPLWEGRLHDQPCNILVGRNFAVLVSDDGTLGALIPSYEARAKRDTGQVTLLNATSAEQPPAGRADPRNGDRRERQAPTIAKHPQGRTQDRPSPPAVAPQAAAQPAARANRPRNRPAGRQGHGELLDLGGGLRAAPGVRARIEEGTVTAKQILDLHASDQHTPGRQDPTSRYYVGPGIAMVVSADNVVVFLQSRDPRRR